MIPTPSASLLLAVYLLLSGILRIVGGPRWLNIATGVLAILTAVLMLVR